MPDAGVLVMSEPNTPGIRGVLSAGGALDPQEE
jgi:hypothetical protein